MKPSGHVITSLGAGGAIYLISQSIPATLAAILSGIFLDIDHLLDYCLHYGFRPSDFSFQRFYETIREIKNERFFVIFHTLEFLAIFWLVIFILKLGIFWFALGIGVTVHILFDQLLNPTHWFSYSLAYRIVKGFKTKDILKVPSK